MNDQRMASAGAIHHLPPKKKQSKTRLWVMATATVLVVAGIFLSYMVLRSASSSSHIDGGKYQAVFLTNGQVYFGKLSGLSGGYMKLKDIYYLQTKADAASDNPQETTAGSDDVELIKLGNEIHGPEDEMIINKDQISFFENLNPDGRVSKSIQSSIEQTK